MKVKTLSGTEVDLSQQELDGLKSRLNGLMIFASDSEYEDSRTVWNAMIEHYPAFVVRCIGASDVMTCVQFAREHDLLLCVKGGGHNIAGLATVDGALMLDMSLMRGVWIDTKAKVAHAQAGCLLGDVDRETQVHNLAAVLGFVSRTGIAGLTLGGGFGYLTRRWGWASDNVVGMDVVTAEGQLVHASEQENSDLFWGLRGGGGNFGVITGIDYKLYPLGSEIIGGPVAWPASEAPSVLKLYRELTENAPPELTLALLLRLAPPAPWLPKEYHGKPVVIMLACYSGDLEQGEKIVASIKSLGNPIGDILTRRPYTQLQSLLDATQPKGRRYYWKSEYLPAVEEGLCQKVMEHADKIPSPYSAVILFHLAGALNKLEDEHSPVGNRNAHFVLNLAGSWEDENDDQLNIDWARRAWEDMKSFSTGGTYINFLVEDEGLERMEAALGKGLKRLSEIKAKWDPENLFRTNRNIKPYY
ncbi:FAD-binding oxidoreductase [uncultured Photobacterium sp.]|uniref:FAD-binding oxidoreductase n=1 Tax=uncultured Photobacterium sp. TaxID=173973 RepID=UPI00260EFE35|nr:FAD-binding oxidoreductase [uncultured Photobacterium sp.]